MHQGIVLWNFKLMYHRNILIILYTSRSAVPLAQMVVLPYNTLLHAGTRKALGNCTKHSLWVKIILSGTRIEHKEQHRDY